MAGWLGHAFQWRRLDQKLAKLRRKHEFKVFHAKDFRARKREFDGWSDAECDLLNNDLSEMMEKTLTGAFAIALERYRYLNEYRAPPIPSKMNLDSQYGVCFRACMAHLADFLAARGHQDRLNVVIEDGHQNVTDCRKIFGDLKQRYERFGIHSLGSFSIERKETCPPLMLADYMAGGYSMIRTRMSFDELEGQGDDYQPLRKGRARCTYMELKSDALQTLKTEFERLRQRDIDRWRAERDARKAALCDIGKT
jgi:hypothetical protein